MAFGTRKLHDVTAQQLASTSSTGTTSTSSSSSVAIKMTANSATTNGQASSNSSKFPQMYAGCGWFFFCVDVLIKIINILQVEMATCLVLARRLDLFKQETRNSWQTLPLGKVVQVGTLYHLTIRLGVQVGMVHQAPMRRQGILFPQTVQ